MQQLTGKEKRRSKESFKKAILMQQRVRLFID